MERGTKLCFLILISCLAAFSQIIVPPQPGNRLTVTVAVTISPKSQTGLYTYSYAATNATTSSQEMWFFAIELNGDATKSIVNSTAPPGWVFSKHPGEPKVSWAATQIDTVPADFVDDGGVVPSPYQLKPGQTLSGFSFQSPTAPTVVRYYAQGFTQIPQALDAGDLDDAGYAAKNYTDDSFIGVTQAPKPTDSSNQPSGLGFFSFVELTNEAVRKSPLTVGVVFNEEAGSIDRASFQAVLNGQDITRFFSLSGVGTNLIATLDSAITPLVNGANVLEGSVSGTDLNATSSQVDFNYVRFYVNTTRNLDLNGDGVVDCADLAIVRASFDKKQDQLGFDPRGDINGDGIVNVVDLAAVAKQIAPGTVCK